MENTVSIIADLNGCLELNSHSDAVNIRSIYTDLQAQGIIDANQNTSQTGQVQLDSSTTTGKTSVVVDSRQLSQALKCTSVRHDRVLFCLTPGKYVSYTLQYLTVLLRWCSICLQSMVAFA